jgi:maleate cis-trans isomerase
VSLAYAPRGLIGVLTPQANTTVEPEFWIMLPPGVAMINARMVSPKDQLEARLADYLENLDAAIAQFANAPLGAIAIATTGTSYIAGAAREQELVDRITRQTGIPFISTGQAVVRALRTLGARTIGLVSPYPESLTQMSAAYWADQGFAIGGIVRIGTRVDTFHPIYSISAANAQAGVQELEGKKLDAIVLLGTGMPTLGAVVGQAHEASPLLLSCMLCLGWAAINAVTGQGAEQRALLQFMRGEEWGARLRARAYPAG